MYRLWKDCQGNFAMIFALTSFVIFGGAGVALDYSRALNVESFIQAQADAAALSSVHLGTDGDPSGYLQFVRASTEERFGPGGWIDKLDMDGKWISATDFEVTVKGQVPVTILAAVPGFPDAVPVSVRAIARMGEPIYVYKPPQVSQLDPEAWDYNRISVYCYDPKKADDPETHGRTQMTVIADNINTPYEYEMPRCGENETLSYKLTNIREARKYPEKMKTAKRYDYFTDTVKKSNVESYALNKPLLETVFCNTLEECKPRSKGGIIPEGKERYPERATKGCGLNDSGKFMYYGWEDRPPPKEGPSRYDDSDSDYDDIRIVIECPSVMQDGEKSVRLLY